MGLSTNYIFFTSPRTTNMTYLVRNLSI